MKNRVRYIDFYKGIGIIIMIMGHIGYGNIFDKYIHAFHMPMFFIISGYLFKNINVSYRHFIIKKIKQLIIPYGVFGLFHLLIFAILNLNDKFTILSKCKALLIINTDNLPITGALWFLTALFFAELLFYLIIKIKIKKMSFVIALLISIGGVIISNYIRLPWGFDISMASLIYMYIGHYIKKIENKIYNINGVYMSIIFIISTVLIFINGYVNLRQGIYAIVPLTYINAIIYSVLILYVSNLICSKIIVFIEPIKKAIIYIGCNSITYLVLNEILAVYLVKLCLMVGIPNIIAKIVCLPIILLVLYVCNIILNTKYLKFAIGKQKIKKEV